MGMVCRRWRQGFKASGFAVKWQKSMPFLQQRYANSGPDTVEELLDRHVVESKHEEDERLVRQRLTSNRREALGLYRDILRATRFFLWPNQHGVPWRDVLRANARQEFEEARYERDPEIIARLLVGGRDAVQAALDKVVARQQQLLNKGAPGDNSR